MLNLIVALPSEARPLIRHFGLVEHGQHPFKHYLGDAMQLVVSGIGIEAAAAATGFAAAITPPGRSARWLNVGTCGHGDYEIGTLVMAGRVRRADDSCSWYPGVAGGIDIPTVTLVSVNAPVTDYPDDSCYDMEGSGFAAAATKIGGHDSVHLLKIVSDNHEHGIENFSREKVDKLISNRLPDIESFITDAWPDGSIQISESAEECYAAIGAALKFTVAERNRLQRLCTRLIALGVEPADLLSTAKAATSEDVFARLEALRQEHSPPSA